MELTNGQLVELTHEAVHWNSQHETQVKDDKNFY